jgi:hypothetical protein
MLCDHAEPTFLRRAGATVIHIVSHDVGGFEEKTNREVGSLMKMTRGDG